MRYSYLEDKEFLKELDSLAIKNKYVKITILDWNENPIKDIQGIVTDGNITIDGQSSMRRAGNLSLIIQDNKIQYEDVEQWYSVNKKVSIEIGIENYTKRYKDFSYIWYPIGIFVINECSLNRSSSGISMDIGIKDKMCLLNGSCGGTLPAAVTFNEMETVDGSGNIKISYPTIYQIIQELVNHFGNEPLHKIIISDIDNRILKYVKWAGDSDVYLYGNINLPETGSVFLTTDLSQAKAYAEDNNSTYRKYEFGEDIGYIYSDFIYTGDLVCNPGDSITSVLDKIINYLGNYEYFYDIDGNFIFQEKKNYLNVSQSTNKLKLLNDSQDYMLDMNEGKSCYDFTNSNLITSYANNPTYENIKNDFVVWGQRTTAGGQSIPIRYHLAIDKKPDIGNSYDLFLYEDSSNITKAKATKDFATRESFPEQGTEGMFYRDCKTNNIYEWKYDNELKQNNYILINSKLKTFISNNWREELYLQGSSAEKFAIDGNYYFAELENEWPKIYDIANQEIFESVINKQSGIDYYLDFIDSQASISRYSVENIGRRTVVLNDTNVNCIFEPTVPNVVFIDSTDKNIDVLINECVNNNQPYIKVSNEIYGGLYGGGVYNSAYSAMKTLLYQYTTFNESISISTLPIYYLEPNTRISVFDSITNIQGDYVINSINITLGNQGTMNINASRALERF